jgi:hypothetical protein
MKPTDEQWKWIQIKNSILIASIAICVVSGMYFLHTLEGFWSMFLILFYTMWEDD